MRLPVVIACLFAFLMSINIQMAEAEVLIADPVLKKKVQIMLSAYHHVPPAKHWKKMPDNVVQVLKVIALDENEWPIRRTRAMDILLYFPESNTKEFLSTMLKDKSEISELITRTAMQTLVKGFNAESLVIIKPYVNDKNFFLRQAAIESMAKIGTKEALKVIETRKSIEKEPVLLKTIEKSLKTMKK